jgi:hypothetical protein
MCKAYLHESGCAELGDHVRHFCWARHAVQQVIQDVLNVPIAHQLEGGSASRGSSSLHLQTAMRVAMSAAATAATHQHTLSQP